MASLELLNQALAQNFFGYLDNHFFVYVHRNKVFTLREQVIFVNKKVSRLPVHPEMKERGQVRGEVKGKAIEKSLSDTERAILELHLHFSECCYLSIFWTK